LIEAPNTLETLESNAITEVWRGLNSELGVCSVDTDRWRVAADVSPARSSLILSSLGLRWRPTLGPHPAEHRCPLDGDRVAAEVLQLLLARLTNRVAGNSFSSSARRHKSNHSALGVLNDYALYKSTHSLTHTSVHEYA